MIKLKKQNESYTKVVGCDYSMSMELSDEFSYMDDNYQFKPSYKYGGWDGKIRLFNRKTNCVPIGLTPLLIKYFKDTDVDFEVDDSLKEKGPKLSSQFIEKFCDKVLKIPEDYDKRDYQLKAVQEMIHHKKLVGVSSTGSGKSFIFYLFVNLLQFISKQDDNKVLILVPTISLVNQMANDFQEYSENFCDFSQYVHKIGGNNKGQKDTDKPITISTWQSLMRMPTEFFEDYNVIITDECLHPDTLITMGNGESKKIIDVKEGDIVLTLNEETKEMEKNKVIKQHKNLFHSQSEKRYKIKTDDDKELIITGNHKVYTSNGYKRVDELEEGEEIISLTE
jgi:reverse gyrase